MYTTASQNEKVLPFLARTSRLRRHSCSIHSFIWFFFLTYTLLRLQLVQKETFLNQTEALEINKLLKGGFARRRDSSHAFYEHCSPGAWWSLFGPAAKRRVSAGSEKHARVESLKSVSCCMLMHSIERKHKRQLANNLVLLAPLGTRTRTRTYTHCTFTCACTHTAHTLKGAFKVTCNRAANADLFLLHLQPSPAENLENGRCKERRRTGGTLLRGGLAVTEQSHGQVLDVGGPLSGQLEELDVVPLHAIDGHWREEKHKRGWRAVMGQTWRRRTDPGPGVTFQDGLLLFGRADETADAFDDLALGVHLLLLQFLSQEDGGNWRQTDRTPTFRTKFITYSQHC